MNTDEYRCEVCGAILDIKQDPIRPWALSIPICQCRRKALEDADERVEQAQSDNEDLENLAFEARELIHAMHLVFAVEDGEESRFETSDYVIRQLMNPARLKDKIEDFLLEYDVERKILLNRVMLERGMEEDIKPWPPE